MTHQENLQRLVQMNALLLAHDFESLEAAVVAHWHKGLMDEETLNTARALRLGGLVVYLATLGVQNVPDSHEHRVWLAVYQALSARAQTAAFAQLPERWPVKWALRAVIAPEDQLPEFARLRTCQGTTYDWMAAYELAIDTERYDLLLGMLEHHPDAFTAEDWLTIGKMMTQRQFGRRRSARLEAFAASFMYVRQQLVGVDSLQQALGYLAASAGHFYLKSDCYEKALSISALLTAPEVAVHQCALAAESHCHLGQHAESIAWLDRLLIMISTDENARAKFYELGAGDDVQGSAGGPSHFDPQQAAVALVDLEKVLASIGQRPFLVSGTLLGYAREGGLLSHDKDIDVGVLGWRNQFDIVEALGASDLFDVKYHYLRGADTYHLACVHLPTQTSIDVFIYHEQDGRYVTGVQSAFGYLQTFAFTPFSLKRVSFLGIDFHVPADFALNLQENFGDWRVPDPDYISHIESPSTMAVGGAVYQLVLRLSFFTTLKDRKPQRFARTLQYAHCHRARAQGASDQVLQAAAELQKYLETSQEGGVA